MFLLIDNYDSFTFNLVQAFMELGKIPTVVRNDDPALLALASDPSLEMVCISPGPGRPETAGLCLDFLRHLPHSVPVLGVCLGHQILGAFFGAGIEVARRIMHGKQSSITHTGSGLFSHLPGDMRVARYHSLLVNPTGMDGAFTVTARTADDEVMAIQAMDRPWAGVQFHPESILTPEGKRLLANFPGALLSDSAAELPQAATKPEPAAVHMPEVIESLAQGKNLDQNVAFEAFSRLMDGELSPSQAGAFLMGLRYKGETAQELLAAVKAVLQRAVAVPPVAGTVIDIVGTGGDGKSSFNCSTATALTLAGMGHKVLKHGNRSVSSRSGSADVLEQLGIPIDLKPEELPAHLDKDGFAFLFAPNYHPAFRHVMPLRRDLGVRTLFNILGPLVNPARPSRFLLGAPRPDIALLLAETQAAAGNTSGAVVCGSGGYDELSAMGPATVIFVRGNDVRQTMLDPREYGFAPCAESDLRVEDPYHAAQVLRELLHGRGAAAMREMVALNLGLALYLVDEQNEQPDPVLGYDRVRMRRCMQNAKDAVANGAGRRFIHA